MKQKWELQEEIDKFTILVKDFNAALSTINRTRRLKIKKDIENLKNTVSQTDLLTLVDHSIQPQQIHRLLKWTWHIS